MTDNAKELLALADDLSDYIKRYSGDWSAAPPTISWDELHAVVSALRLSARQQTSVEEGVLTLGPENEAFHRALKQYPEGFAALHFFWNEVFAGQPQSRPDTAEARLREVANHLFLSPEFKHYHKSVAARADAAKALALAALDGGR